MPLKKIFTLMFSMTLTLTSYAQTTQAIDPDCLPQKATTHKHIAHKPNKKKTVRTKPRGKKSATVHHYVSPLKPNQRAKPAKRCVPLPPKTQASSTVSSSENGGGGGGGTFNDSGYNPELDNSRRIASFESIPTKDDGEGEPLPPDELIIKEPPHALFPDSQPPIIINNSRPPSPPLLPPQSFPTQTPPVPEPETYGLILVGLSIVGIVNKRRKAAQNTL